MGATPRRSHAADAASAAQHSRIPRSSAHCAPFTAARWAVLMSVPRSRVQVARAATSKQPTHRGGRERSYSRDQNSPCGDPQPQGGGGGSQEAA